MPEQLVSDADHVSLPRLVVEIAWRIDHGRADSVWELFVPDGVLDTGGTPLAGHDPIREWRRGGPPRACERDTSAPACDGPGSAVPAVVGEDTDEFVRTDAGWRFVSRRFERLFA